MDGADLVFLIPIWRRTCNIARVADAVAETTPAARILFVVSTLDVEPVNVIADLAHPNVDVLFVEGRGGEQGDYAHKINAGYRATREAFLFTGADDLIPYPGWFEAARALMSDTVGVVGTVDKCNNRTMKGTHSTHSLVARWYADQGGSLDEAHVIYHEGYWHEFCDDELIRTAMHRGAYAHAYDAVVEHVHMLVDRTLDDDVYRHGRSHSSLSRRLFHQRRRLWGENGRPPQRPRRVTRPTR